MLLKSVDFLVMPCLAPGFLGPCAANAPAAQSPSSPVGLLYHDIPGRREESVLQNGLCSTKSNADGEWYGATPGFCVRNRHENGRLTLVVFCALLLPCSVLSSNLPHALLMDMQKPECQLPVALITVTSICKRRRA